VPWSLALACLSALTFVVTLATASPSDQQPGGGVELVEVVAFVLVAAAVVAVAASWPALRSASRAAVREVERGRRRRADARAIVARDPAMARELRIGRPDLRGRTYDDGGLVDINHATADILQTMLDLSPPQAAELVRVRSEIDGFAGLGEVGAFTTLPVDVVDRLRERAVCVPR
jgi:hypothetical protein